MNIALLCASLHNTARFLPLVSADVFSGELFPSGRRRVCSELRLAKIAFACNGGWVLLSLRSISGVEHPLSAT